MARLTFSCAPSRAPSRALSAHQQHLSLSCSFMPCTRAMAAHHPAQHAFASTAVWIAVPPICPESCSVFVSVSWLDAASTGCGKKTATSPISSLACVQHHASPVGFTRRLHLLASRRRRHTVSFTTRQFGCAVLARVTRRTASSNVLISNGFGKRQTRVGEPGGNTVAGSPDTNTHPIARPSTSSARA